VPALDDLVSELSPDRAADLLAGGHAQLIDVREPYEHEAGRIEDARHIPLDQLAREAETIDRDRPVIVHCRVGGRSAMVVQALRAAGYDAHNLAGGLEAWVARGLPIVPVGGYVAPH
jgi:rhodanese-related sulfurtransferase